MGHEKKLCDEVETVRLIQYLAQVEDVSLLCLLEL